MKIFENKYNLTKEENIFLAKRNIIDSLWKSANLEGIAITFPETQALYDGINISHLRIDEIQTINNLKHAWNFLLSTIDSTLDFNYISSINALVGSNIIDTPGKIRKYGVTMGGTSWVPDLPSIEKLNNLISWYNSNTNSTDKILTILCTLMKMQLFNDGNKRTSFLIANHELISNGFGIISISNENKIEFGELLIKYYEDDSNIDNLKDFLYTKCLYR